jgi:hypothetical protein
MISQKYTQEEANNLNQIDEVLSRDSRYIRIEPGKSKVLQFIVERKIEQVERPYTNGQINKRIRFVVIEPDSSNSNNSDHQEKFFEVGRRSARLIIAKLKEGHTLLKIERVGSGKETLYVPTPASSK